MSEKVGVYICHCGTNIAGTIDVEDVSVWAGDSAGKRARLYLFCIGCVSRKARDSQSQITPESTSSPSYMLLAISVIRIC